MKPNSGKLLLKLLVGSAVGAALGARLATGSAPSWVRSLGFPLEIRIAIALLVAFSIYWTIASRNSAASQNSESTVSRQLHLWVVGIAQVLLILSVPGLTHRFIPDHQLFRIIGLLLEAAFLLLSIWSRRHLGDNWAGEVRIASQHQLVRSGPYRYIRHPIYTGILGAYCGVALVSGEVHALAALAIFFFAYWRKITLEERALQQAFDSAHKQYQRESWKLVPWVY